MTSITVSMVNADDWKLSFPIKEGDLVWIKLRKNKSRNVLAYARKVKTNNSESVITVSPATSKEKDNYKSMRLIKRLK